MLGNFYNKKRTEKTIYELNGLEFPVFIYYEKRGNVRVSVARKAVNLRMPYTLSALARKKHFAWFEGWLKKNEAYLKEHFAVKEYRTGNELVVGNRKYEIRMEDSSNKSHSGKLENGIIRLKINPTKENHQRAVKTLLSRIVGNDFLPEMERRVTELNHLHFKVPVEAVKLKYTSSRWGSCSSRGNINFSTRLLFAPEVVVDYVIIHELAHRIEMNHSPRFWKLVSDAMPDYERHEKWLKEFGRDCDF